MLTHLFAPANLKAADPATAPQWLKIDNEVAQGLESPDY